jgi:hypothetical protein
MHRLGGYIENAILTLWGKKAVVPTYKCVSRPGYRAIGFYILVHGDGFARQIFEEAVVIAGSRSYISLADNVDRVGAAADAE